MEIQKTVQAFQRLKGQETKIQPAGIDTPHTSEAEPPCHVMGFAGAKGGVGTTTVALNVAMTLVQGGHSVIYVELSPHVGTAAWLLNMTNKSPLNHASATLKDMNEAVVNQLLMQHSTGLQVLCVSPWDQEVGAQVSTELLTGLFRELKGHADYLVLDFPLEPSFPSVCFLSQCQILDLVMESDAIGMNLAKSQLAFIRSHCETPVFVTLVNRSGIPLADGLQGVQEEIGYEIPVVIPAASELCYTAGIKKLPIVCFNPESVLAMQFAQLSEQLLGYFSEDGSEENRDRRGRDRRKGNRRDRGAW
ncbi:MAG: AAA family ATPase [Nitrospirota bacterium]|nr:AAA family ATPase [Nitrospirota bacterium]